MALTLDGKFPSKEPDIPKISPVDLETCNTTDSVPLTLFWELNQSVLGIVLIRAISDTETFAL